MYLTWRKHTEKSRIKETALKKLELRNVEAWRIQNQKYTKLGNDFQRNRP